MPHSRLPAFPSIVDALRSHASTTPERALYRFVGARDETNEPYLSYGALDRAARRIAAHLLEKATPGAVALLLYPPGLEFIEAFMGCLYAGVIAVPVYLPNGRADSWARLSTIANDAGAVLLLADDLHRDGVTRWMLDGGAPAGLRMYTSGVQDDEGPVLSEPVAITPETVAFLQYTSGSTGDPKGVMVSHGNLIANQAQIQSSFGNDASDIVAGWLPQYHDMGLIGNILQPLYLGATAVLMQPLTFLQDPARWLEVISEYGATISGGPDFAYGLCVRRTDETRRSRLDLSRWRVAFNGAEPVSPATMNTFSHTFAAQGFRREAFYPCYGLAEATLLVTGSIPGAGPTTLHVNRAALATNVAEPMDDGVSAIELSGSGRIGDQAICIVDPLSSRLREAGSIGEICIRGPSVTRGYWRRETIDANQFQARVDGSDDAWLRTGDLGFVHDGELYITGRHKDLIIVRGRNYYPQDIERSVQQAFPELREGCGAAIAIPGDDGEALVLVQELERTALRRESHEALFKAVTAHVADTFGIRLQTLVLSKPTTVPKTSSGKLRRSACRDALLAGRLPGIVARFDVAGTSTATGADDLVTVHTTPLAVVAHVLGLSADTLDTSLSLTAQGLDSLGAAELEHLFSRHYGVRLDMTELLGGLTLEQALSRAADGRLASASTTAVAMLSGHAGSLRQAIWKAHAMYPRSAVYTIATAFDTAVPLTEATFARAVERLVRRHPILATTYQEHDGDILPVAGTDDSQHLMLMDAQDWSDDDVDAFLSAEASRRIDLAEGPVFLVNLLRRADGRHTVQLRVHHIAVDARSMQNLVRQLAGDYTALMRGDEAVVHPANDYERFEAERDAWLDSGDGKTALRDYATLVGDSTANLELASDGSRPSRFDFAGAEHLLTLPAADLAGLAAYAATLGATPFHVFLAAWAIVLRRLGGNDDFVLGVPVSDRPPGTYDDAVGCFVDLKHVPCHVHPDNDATTVVHAVRKSMLDILAVRRAPSHRALREHVARTDWASAVSPNLRFALLQSPSTEGVEPFLMNLHGAPLDVDGWIIQPHAVPATTTPADLALTVAMHDGGLLAKFVYSTTLFSSVRIASVALMYREVLGAMLARDPRPVRLLPLIDAETRRRQLAASAAMPMARPTHRCIHARFESMARAQPRAPAVIFEDTLVTYEELDRAANRLANVLRSRGIGVGDRVALYMRRSTDMVLAFLAALKAGACSVMLEPSLPVERCHYIIGDAGVTLLLTNMDDLAPLEPGAIPVLNIAHISGHESDVAVPIDLDEDDAAYIIYTSGSTGRPKGVIGLHRGIVNRTEWMIRHFQTGPGDRILHTTPLGFVRAEREIFFALCSGAALVVQPEGGLNRPDLILDALDRYAITSTASSPSLLRMILDQGADRLAALPQLRHWFIGADVLRADLVAAVHRASPTIALAYFYGSTEVASDVACFDVPRPYEGPVQLPAGHALPNTPLYILDDNGEPVAAGIAGELHVGGIQLARGYVGDDALTASRFIDDPFLPGGRLYRTGDLATRDPEGRLVVSGRQDDQISVEGHRVEPVEVEHAIRGTAGVNDVVVMQHGSGVQRGPVVAYVAGIDAARASLLRAALAVHLPSYMIPAVFVPLLHLPVTSLGKIDRAALRAIDLNSVAPPRVHAPVTPLETAVAQLMGELCQLPVEMIDVSSNFAELGVNSALLSQFVVRLNALSPPRTVAITDVYLYPSIRSLATALESTGPAPEDGQRTMETNARADARRAALSRRGVRAR